MSERAPSLTASQVSRRVARALWARLFALARWLIIPAVVVRLAATVWRSREALREAEVICIYEGGGFGHEVIAPDIVRRLFPGRRSVVLFAAIPGEHNFRVPEMWAAPTLCLLPFGFSLCQARAVRPPWSIQLRLCRVLGGLLRRVLPDSLVIPSLNDLHNRLAADQGFTRSDYLLAYFHLLRQPPSLSQVRLPAMTTAPIRRALAAAVGGAKPVRLCCLYLRKRGGDSVAETETSIRSGSELSDFLPAIRALNRAGYQCLLIGDRPLPDKTAAEFAGWLVNASPLCLDPWTVSLFAATEADIFIGEAGGASFLPGLNGIPTLIVNNFPYYQTRYRATVFPKLCYDRDGRLITPQKMFTEFARCYRIPGGEIRSNSAAEIYEAITEFMTEHHRDAPYGTPVEDIVGSPNNLWFADAESRISPAWLRLTKTSQAHGDAAASAVERSQCPRE